MIELKIIRSHFYFQIMTKQKMCYLLASLQSQKSNVLTGKHRPTVFLVFLSFGGKRQRVHIQYLSTLVKAKALRLPDANGELTDIKPEKPDVQALKGNLNFCFQILGNKLYHCVVFLFCIVADSQLERRGFKAERRWVINT